MTYADDNQYPPSGPTGWLPPRTEPRSYGHHAPGYGRYGQAAWGEPYGQAAWDEPYGQAAWDEPYGQAAWDEPYGQAAWDEPYRPETHGRAEDLAALRSAYRLLRRVSTLTALGSFVVYVVLSCYAPGLMGAEIAGELSLGMALGILQLVVTFAAVFWYGRSAQRSVDPLAHAVRDRAVPTGRNAGMAR
ncbi:DUF485 domain-containing protein [Streptomyces cyaneus]|uniref:DUF485 domain-containing protein n=1 Tax=Streptomyces cyaneus TaxID=1904 RepID=UPI000FF899E9|nr:DUF485 domain-containing protein [Streptomyces cyaneus]